MESKREIMTVNCVFVFCVESCMQIWKSIKCGNFVWSYTYFFRGFYAFVSRSTRSFRTVYNSFMRRAMRVECFYSLHRMCLCCCFHKQFMLTIMLYTNEFMSSESCVAAAAAAAAVVLDEARFLAYLNERTRAAKWGVDLCVVYRYLCWQFK